MFDFFFFFLSSKFSRRDFSLVTQVCLFLITIFRYKFQKVEYSVRSPRSYFFLVHALGSWFTLTTLLCLSFSRCEIGLTALLVARGGYKTSLANSWKTPWDGSVSQNGSALLLIIIIVIIFKWLRAISKFNNKMNVSNNSFHVHDLWSCISQIKWQNTCRIWYNDLSKWSSTNSKLCD